MLHKTVSMCVLETVKKNMKTLNLFDGFNDYIVLFCTVGHVLLSVSHPCYILGRTHSVLSAAPCQPTSGYPVVNDSFSSWGQIGVQ